MNTDDTFEWVGVLTTLTPAEEEEDTDETTEETEAASYLTMGFAAAAVVASMF